jgi:hypothetical protein
MGISKSQCSWMVEGVKSTSGNTMTFYKTNFNMPVPCLFNGSSDENNGFMCVRYCDIGWTSQGLVGFCPGYEVALQDSLFRWCVSDGSCLNGNSCICQKWCRSGCIMGTNARTVNINISSSPGYYTITWWELMQNTGVAGWEMCCTGTYCAHSCATWISGNDVSIPVCNICSDFSPPSTSQCSSTLTGSIWVGTDCKLHYINANRWEHTITGTDNGIVISTSPGAIWISTGINAHYLHWLGSDCHDYSAPWRICQFCSTFTNGAPANPAPGASYAGSIWVDNQFGWTHLSYIGCDGNKYLTGGANYPYQAP